MVATGTALALAGLSAAGAIGSSAIGSRAAGKAAEQQAQGQQGAIDETRRQFDISQANSQPFVQAGQQSIGTLMDALRSGRFGVGSAGAAPADFKAPTLEEVQQTPGYQFAAQQGSKGILQASAAGGGGISGGTSKALQGYQTQLANTTYGDAFSRAMQAYQSQLAGYGTRLAANQQEFGQMLAPAQLGAGATAQINQIGGNASSNIAQLMAGIGSSRAAGTIGGATSIANGISGATNSISQAMLMAKLFGSPSGITPGAALPGTSSIPGGAGNAALLLPGTATYTPG
jgi:hypothetical protein|tara:strand:- start:2843 stop:3706 length:864 start_codon:yes stop_codon:yes gene_type:complete